MIRQHRSGQEEERCERPGRGRTLTELPAFFSTTAGWAATAVSSERCPLQVDATAEDASVACGGLTYQIRRRPGR